MYSLVKRGSHKRAQRLDQLKNERKDYGKIICLTLGGSQICLGYKVHDLITCELRVHVVVFQGS